MAARSAAEELQGVRVVRIFPGAVRTALVESVLNANDKSPTSEIFKALNVAGTIVDPTETGKFIADILLWASDEQLDAREFWDFGNADDHLNRDDT